MTKTRIKWPLVTPMRCGLLFSSQACSPKEYPRSSYGHFWKISFDIKAHLEKGTFLNAECLANPKNTTFPRVLTCTWGDFRFLMKQSCVFGRFERFWAIFGILGEPAEIPGDTFGVQAREKTEDHPSRGSFEAI